MGSRLNWPAVTRFRVTLWAFRHLARFCVGFCSLWIAVTIIVFFVIVSIPVGGIESEAAPQMNPMLASSPAQGGTSRANVLFGSIPVVSGSVRPEPAIAGVYKIRGDSKHPTLAWYS